MTDYRLLLTQLLPTQQATIQSHRLPDGRIVWLRRIGKLIPPWRYRLLGGLAAVLKLGALQPVPNPGGQAALDTEARRLRELAALDIAVPELLAEAPGGILFSHLGNHTLLSELEHADEVCSVWQQGLEALAEVHRKGGYLSQAFARNIIRMDNGRLGFIDFEDDPGRLLPLALCQSRDWLCYLQSSALWLEQHPKGLEQAAVLWQRQLAAMPAEVREPVRRTLRKIAFLHRFHARFWGNDTLRLAAAARLTRLAEPLSHNG